MHRSHMILSKLRFHIEAILQVIKVLSLSFCLIVQLTALCVLVFVSHKPRLGSVLPLMAIDAVIFNSDAGSSCQRLFSQCLFTGILLLKVGNVIEILTLGIVACHTMVDVLLASSGQELLWLLGLDTGDQLAQELLLVINFGIVDDFLHQALLIF
jgi:hypothetical protein